MKKSLGYIYIIALCLFSILHIASSQEKNDIVSNNSIAFLSQDVDIPEQIQIIAKIVFGLQIGEKIALSHFIVLLSLLVILFLLLHEILIAVPFFDSTFKAWFGAVIISLLIASSGAVKDVTFFLFNLVNSMSILTNSLLLQVFFVLIVSALIFYGVFYLLKIIKKKANLESAKRTGLELGYGYRKNKN